MNIFGNLPSFGGNSGGGGFNPFQPINDIFKPVSDIFKPITDITGGVSDFLSGDWLIYLAIGGGIVLLILLLK
jgi:hypothetical protein